MRSPFHLLVSFLSVSVSMACLTEKVKGKDAENKNQQGQEKVAVIELWEWAGPGQGYWRRGHVQHVGFGKQWILKARRTGRLLLLETERYGFLGTYWDGFLVTGRYLFLGVR